MADKLADAMVIWQIAKLGDAWNELPDVNETKIYNNNSTNNKISLNNGSNTNVYDPGFDTLGIEGGGIIGGANPNSRYITGIP